MMAVLDPIKLVIDNYPEGQVEYLDAREQSGECRNLEPERFRLAESFILKEKTSWIDPPKKYIRLLPGNRSASDERIFCNLYRF